MAVPLSKFYIETPIATSKHELFSDNFSMVNSKFVKLITVHIVFDLETYKE